MAKRKIRDDIDDVSKDAVLGFPQLNADEIQNLLEFLQRAYRVGCADGRSEEFINHYEDY